MEKSLAKFSYDHTMHRPILLTSIRKSGTHAIRNVLAHFTGPQRTHWEFVGDEMIRENIDKFKEATRRTKLFNGHVRRTASVNAVFREAKIVLVYRDPYTQVVSRAMHYFSEGAGDPLSSHLKDKDASIEEAIFYAIHGGIYKGWPYPPIEHDYMGIAVGWLDRCDSVIRYEDFVSNQDVVFQAIEKIGLDNIPQARERVAAGLIKEISASYWTKKKKIEISETQKRMIDARLPGVREILGYEAREVSPTGIGFSLPSATEGTEATETTELTETTEEPGLAQPSTQEEAPAVEPSAVEVPAVEPSAVEAPAVEPSAVEVPAVETPVAQESAPGAPEMSFLRRAAHKVASPWRRFFGWHVLADKMGGLEGQLAGLHNEMAELQSETAGMHNETAAFYSEMTERLGELQWRMSESFPNVMQRLGNTQWHLSEISYALDMKWVDEAPDADNAEPDAPSLQQEQPSEPEAAPEQSDSAQDSQLTAIDFVDLEEYCVFMFKDDIYEQHVPDHQKNKSSYEFLKEVRRDGFRKPKTPRLVAEIENAAAAFHCVAAFFWDKKIDFSVLDVGCHVGSFGLSMGSYFRSHGKKNRVFCIDPGSTRALVPKSIAINGLDDIVSFHEVAISDVNGPLFFFNTPRLTVNNSILQETYHEGHEIVMSSTLESFIAENKIKDSLFLKIDTEGIDYAIVKDIAAFAKTEEKVLAVIIEFAPRHIIGHEEPTAFLAWLHEDYHLLDVTACPTPSAVTLVEEADFDTVVENARNSGGSFRDILAVSRTLPGAEDLVEKLASLK